MGEFTSQLPWFDRIGKDWLVIQIELKSTGGEWGIRTPGTVTSTTVFETVPFDHSGNSPNDGRKDKKLF